MAEPTLDEFRDEATAFLDANAERRVEVKGDQKFVWGEGDDDVAILEETSREEELADLAEAKDWRAKRYDAGFGWITGPTQYGGRELPVAYDRAYASLEGSYQIPSQSHFGIGLGMVAPTILAHATEKVKDLYLAKLYRGDLVASPAVQRAGRRLRPGRPADQGRQATATSGSSTARRCGPPAPTTATSARSSAAPTPTSPSTRASPASSST